MIALTNKYNKCNGLVKKTDYNTNITKIEDKIPSISRLATSTLTTVENKIPHVSNLVKEQIIKKKYQVLNLYILLRQADYNKFISKALDAKIKQKR